MSGWSSGWTGQRVSWLQERAVACGFTLAGIAATEGVSEAEHIDAQHFANWIDAGYAGEMEYLKRRDSDGRLLRSEVRVALTWARSVVVCSTSYRTAGPSSTDTAAPGAGWIGRYAWSGTQQEQTTITGGSPEAAVGPKAETERVASSSAGLRPIDYHEVLLARLRALESAIQAEADPGFPVQSRCYVDTGPIVERSLAARAGVGWIGKNTTVINQEVGSWTLLATIITSIPIPANDRQMAADRCGSCTRCIDACPTDALVAPRQMDARRCIAYLTIEKKDMIEENLREGMGRQIFGCDICQDVCPWNRRVPPAQDADMLPRPELINPDLEWLADMGPAEFRRWFSGSPLERTGQKRLRRNVAIAMGNSGETRFRSRLEVWAAGSDEVLAQTARWALGRLAQGEDAEV